MASRSASSTDSLRIAAKRSTTSAMRRAGAPDHPYRGHDGFKAWQEQTVAGDALEVFRPRRPHAEPRCVSVSNSRIACFTPGLKLRRPLVRRLWLGHDRRIEHPRRLHQPRLSAKRYLDTTTADVGHSGPAEGFGLRSKCRPPANPQTRLPCPFTDLVLIVAFHMKRGRHPPGQGAVGALHPRVCKLL